MIIAIEGIDGAGKTTLARTLHKLLSRMGIDNVAIKFPSEDAIEELQHAKTNAQKAEIFAKDFTHLFNEPTQVIIVDRYIPSVYVHQQVSLDPEFEQTHLSLFACDKPDITIWLRVNPERAYERICKRDGEPEQTLEELKELDSRYANYFTANPEHVLVVQDETYDAILN